jgi:uncharacterized protein (TIGR03437 family)
VAQEVIRVDFQPNAPFSGRPPVNFTGVESQAAAASPLFGTDGSNTWNYLSVAPGVLVTNPSFSNLVDSTGATTNVGIAFTGVLFAADDNPIDNNASDGVENDYFAIGATPLSYVISGLPPNVQVTMYLYAPNFVLYDSGNPVGQPSRAYTLTANGTTINVPSGPDDNALATVTTDGSGNISGTWSTAGNEGDWSGFQLAYFPPPSIGGLLNNYSYIRPGLPNYGIAQGSIFDIFGTNLATSTASQGVPLQKSLGGASISVTVNGVTTQAIPYFASPFQIAAILPSATPAGTGTITVTTGGQTSAPAPIVVLPSAFGLLSVSASGSGAAAAYDYNEGNKLLTQTNAANPGEYIVLWGTGLGPVTGDETVYQTQTNLTGIPIEVDIGGVSATVAYHGRSIYPGLDQINVIVPPGVTGCSVSLVVSESGVPSNFTTIPVAASGRICSDPVTSPFSTSDWQTLSSLSTVNLGLISLGTVSTTTLPVTVGSVTTLGTTTTSDEANAVFVSYSSAQLLESGFGQNASLGSCVVSTFEYNRIAGTGLSGPSPISVNTATTLDAGSQITLNGPNGTIALLPQNGYYSPTGTPVIVTAAGGGSFTFSNGSGGKDVGGFSTTLAESGTNPLVWSNQPAITAVARSQGQTVQWTGGVTASFVLISGSSATFDSTGDTIGATFACAAPVSAGQFTVPTSVLESLPASGTVDGVSVPGSLSVADVALPQKFSASGLNEGIAVFFETNSLEVPYN